MQSFSIVRMCVATKTNAADSKRDIQRSLTPWPLPSDDVQKLSKRVHALGMEVAKKDNISVALRNQVQSFLGQDCACHHRSCKVSPWIRLGCSFLLVSVLNNQRQTLEVGDPRGHWGWQIQELNDMAVEAVDKQIHIDNDSESLLGNVQELSAGRPPPLPSRAEGRRADRIPGAQIASAAPHCRASLD